MVSGKRAWRRCGRCPVRRLQPGRQATRHLPTRDGTDPHLLQPPQYGASPHLRQIHVEIQRSALDAPVPIRLRLELYDVRLLESQIVGHEDFEWRLADRD